ncbi:MAG: hypothetical protein ACE5EI_09465 [Thermodesulfobacteriota bacterium]
MSRSKMGARAVVAAVLIAGAVLAGGVLTYTFSGTDAQAAELSAATPSEVCMVNDRVFGKPQIPVEYDGKTYYGCCAGCVTRIKEDRTVRYSTDPVTGREVDKATAVILEGAEGEALYFESMETAKRYRAPVSK